MVLMTATRNLVEYVLQGASTAFTLHSCEDRLAAPCRAGDHSGRGPVPVAAEPASGRFARACRLCVRWCWSPHRASGRHHGSLQQHHWPTLCECDILCCEVWVGLRILTLNYHAPLAPSLCGFDLQPEEHLPLILVGAGKTLQLRNVTVLGAASLSACLHLGPGEALRLQTARILVLADLSLRA